MKREYACKFKILGCLNCREWNLGIVEEILLSKKAHIPKKDPKPLNLSRSINLLNPTRPS